MPRFATLFLDAVCRCASAGKINVTVASLQESLLDLVRGAATRSGGWPYYAGKASRVEPTGWVLLALNAVWKDDAASWNRFAAPHLAWLASLQQPTGLLVDQAGAPPNFTANATAACALAEIGASGGPSLSRLVDGLVAAAPLSVDDHDARQDNSLRGWSWMPGTVSWLEPTCWGVLALKKAGRAAAAAPARIAEAEKLIVNRTCTPGGWNYGNASAVGQDLRPYVPTTAIGLIALQDRAGDPAVGRSLAWLRENRLKEPSAMALALAAAALRIHGVAVDDVDAGLEADAARAERVGNIQALAMMLYALTAPTHDLKTLRV